MTPAGKERDLQSFLTFGFQATNRACCRPYLVSIAVQAFVPAIRLNMSVLPSLHGKMLRETEKKERRLTSKSLNPMPPRTSRDGIPRAKSAHTSTVGHSGVELLALAAHTGIPVEKVRHVQTVVLYETVAEAPRPGLGYLRGVAVLGDDTIFHGKIISSRAVLLPREEDTIAARRRGIVDTAGDGGVPLDQLGEGYPVEVGKVFAAVAGYGVVLADGDDGRLAVEDAVKDGVIGEGVHVTRVGEGRVEDYGCGQGREVCLGEGEKRPVFLRLMVVQ